MRRVRPLVDRESVFTERKRKAALQREQVRLPRSRAEPCDAAAPETADLVECQGKALTAHVPRELPQSHDSTRRLLAEKREREMLVARCRRAPTRLTCDLAREIGKDGAKRVLGPEGEKDSR